VERFGGNWLAEVDARKAPTSHPGHPWEPTVEPCGLRVYSTNVIDELCCPLTNLALGFTVDSKFHVPI
jgi:hypothetical protein